MNTKLISRTLILTLATLLAPQILAAKESGYPAVPLLSTESTIVGEPIAYPVTGKARVTASIVTLAPNSKTVLHKHGVHMFA